MIFVCALIPLSCIVFKAFWGDGASVLSALLSFVLLPLHAKPVKSKTANALLMPFFVLSVFFRLYSLFAVSHEEIGPVSAVILVFAVAAISGFAAYYGRSAVYMATPAFFTVCIIAVYTVCVSARAQYLATFGLKDTVGAVAAAVCSVSACAAFNSVGAFSRIGRAKGLLCGALLCALFFLFGGATAEFGFVLIPITVCVTAIELKAVLKVILPTPDE